MRDFLPVVVIVLILVCAFVMVMNTDDECSTRKCPPGLSATLMLQHRHVYKCVCVGVPE